MKAEDVPERLVEVIRDEIGAAELCGDGTCRACNATLRAALAAVIPLVQAAEREACARIADVYLRMGSDDADVACNTIAAAIRALPAPPPEVEK